MDFLLPPEMLVERDALVAEIHAAFEGVTREGGVSWSETYVLDFYGTDEERATARAKDVDVRWEQLVKEIEWEGSNGCGGWSFIDPIGFRYYLPVQMVRSVREGLDYGDLGVAFHITIELGAKDPGLERTWKEYRGGRFSLLSPRQWRCVRRFLLYMEAVDRLCGFPYGSWTTALDGCWRDLPDLKAQSGSEHA